MFVVEVADLVLDGCLVVCHIRVVRGVVVLGQSIELILYARVCVCVRACVCVGVCIWCEGEDREGMN